MIRGLKYIRDIIQSYWENHAMVNEIKFGDVDNLSTYKDLKYPLINYEYLDSNYRAGFQNTARFEFQVMDLTDGDDLEMDFNIIANANEIAQDFLKWLEKHNDLEMSPNVSIIPFSDSFGDRVSGVAFTVTFNVFRNNCSFL